MSLVNISKTEALMVLVKEYERLKLWSTCQRFVTLKHSGNIAIDIGYYGEKNLPNLKTKKMLPFHSSRKCEKVDMFSGGIKKEHQVVMG